MISILYDSYSFDREDVGGITRYFTEVMCRLPAEQARAIVTTQETHNLYLQNGPYNIASPRYSARSFCSRLRFPGKYRVYRFLSRYFPFLVPGCEEGNRRSFLRAVTVGDFDVAHMTGLGYDWKALAQRKPFVVTIHDLIPELFYHDRRYGAMRRELYSAATHIIAVSEHTRQDAIRYYGIDPAKITTVYHGVTQPAEPIKVAALEGVRYVLYVGKRGGYKNFDFFVRVLGRLMSTDHSLWLVCTGSSFTEQEQASLKGLGIYPRTLCRRFSDGELRWVFEHAQVFVYPSLYEGFGLPILDAFAAGCPVLLSRASCFPEVAEKAALYFEPDNANDLQQKLLQVLDVGEAGRRLRLELVEHGRNRVRLFSWARCAHETVAVYQSAINEFRGHHA